MAEAGLLSELSGVKLGGGFVAGALTGYLSKKITKLIAIIVGLFLAALQFMESRGWVNVDWSALTAGLAGAGSEAAAKAPSLLSSVVSTLGLGAAFTGGFLLGFKKG